MFPGGRPVEERFDFCISLLRVMVPEHIVILRSNDERIVDYKKSKSARACFLIFQTGHSKLTPGEIIEINQDKTVWYCNARASLHRMMVELYREHIDGLFINNQY